MKNIFLFILINISALFSAQQIFTLRPTETELPVNSYQKDTNNELPSYEGTWKGIWDNKIIYITFTKITHNYDSDFKYYRDYLIGKFKVLDNNENILFDNTNANDDTKITGINFRRYGDKYSLIYVDSDLCNTTGNIRINFTDPSKLQLDWKLILDNNMITNDCQYYHTGIPKVLPKEITLTKQ
ncbi:MAG: hypothetical protein LBE92_06180 [Chryseobacterium sp.]|jgi:hypothetical protein|uniref:DUF6705 family protein n=1 Tax=Chryseobacterium sp. TaxID=1871047 RepID=UPI0028279E1A|nr:DUF6705 family protein [Chryseobacterium sp.]MDR2235691.1 hypothetical protein [Chryseobacterium sp.]